MSEMFYNCALFNNGNNIGLSTYPLVLNLNTFVLTSYENYDYGCPVFLSENKPLQLNYDDVCTFKVIGKNSSLTSLEYLPFIITNASNIKIATSTMVDNSNTLSYI
jgi:hypothetical protein